MAEPTEPQQSQQSADPAVSAGVWPPPPTNTPGATAPYAATFPFVPVQRLANAIMVLLSIDCLFSVYAGLSAALLASQAARATATEIAAFFQAVLLLAAGICFFTWVYRMDKNLRAFGAEELQFRPSWVIGWFFVPIMNLYRPYQALSEIWQASDPDPAARTKAGRRPIHPPTLLGVWWGFWLLWSVIDGIAAQDVSGSASSAAPAPFRLAAAILAILVVRLYTKRQQKTARHLALIS
jgi:hypothetical protein